MRVTIISKAFVVGAYQTKLEAIAAHADVHLTVVVPRTWREEGHTLRLERLHSTGYDMIVAPILLNGSYHLHFYPGVVRFLRETRPDICHIDEEPYNLATYLALRAARQLGARCLFFTWQNLLRRYPFPFGTLERYVYDHVDAAIAGNHDAVRVLRAKGYGGPIEVIPQFGVDPTIYRPPASRAPNDVWTIGYAGRLVEQKGLWILLDAAARLSGEWQMLLYGSGPLRQALIQRVTALGLSQQVIFRERVPSAQMPDHLSQLDVLVLPSLTRPNWKEQFGRILVEAMACGVPVVGSDSGEIPQVIGDSGIVVPEGCAEALRVALERLRDDAALRRDLAVRGRARVLAHYTQAQVAAETVALYRSLFHRAVPPVNVPPVDVPS